MLGSARSVERRKSARASDDRSPWQEHTHGLERVVTDLWNEMIEHDHEESYGEYAEDQASRVVRQVPGQDPRVQQPDLQSDPSNIREVDQNGDARDRYGLPSPSYLGERDQNTGKDGRNLYTRAYAFYLELVYESAAVHDSRRCGNPDPVQQRRRVIGCNLLENKVVGQIVETGRQNHHHEDVDHDGA